MWPLDRTAPGPNALYSSRDFLAESELKLENALWKDSTVFLQIAGQISVRYCFSVVRNTRSRLFRPDQEPHTVSVDTLSELLGTGHYLSPDF